MTPPVKLVVGADGVVGGALLTHLRTAGERVLSTTRRMSRTDDSHLFLDLSEDPSRWSLPGDVSVAFICAGATKLADCRRDPAGTAAVNVRGIPALAAALVAQGAFVIFLSTNQVFDGTMPCRGPEEAVCPTTEYGRQKAEAERRLAQWHDSVAIVRFTKILEPRPPLFVGWMQSLLRGEPIHPFSDMYMAPVPLACAISALRLVADRRLGGIHQVSGGVDISYAQAAEIGAKVQGISEGLLAPIDAAHAGFEEALPLHTTLNTDRLRHELGIEVPDVAGTVKQVFAKCLPAQAK